MTSGPALVNKGDLAGLLTALAPRDILFIDEIHRLSPAVEEALYPAMEDSASTSSSARASARRPCR